MLFKRDKLLERCEVLAVVMMKISSLLGYDVMSIGHETFWGSFLPSYSGQKDLGLL